MRSADDGLRSLQERSVRAFRILWMSSSEQPSEESADTAAGDSHHHDNGHRCGHYADDDGAVSTELSARFFVHRLQLKSLKTEIQAVISTCTPTPAAHFTTL